MGENFRYNILFVVQSLYRVTNLQPIGCWQSVLAFNVTVECNYCGGTYGFTFENELVFECMSPGCPSRGSFTVLKCKGKPFNRSGETQIVRSIAVSGSMTMTFNAFDFYWSCTMHRADGGSWEVDDIQLDNDGDYVYRTDSSSENEASTDSDAETYERVPRIKGVSLHQIIVNSNTDLLNFDSDDDD